MPPRPACTGVRRGRMQRLRGQHRHQADGHAKRAQERKSHHERELFEHHARHAANKDQRQKHHHGRQRAGDDGGGDLLAAMDGRGFAAFARVAQAIDILQHYDGIVQQHAHTQGQATDRHDVQREPAEVHQGKRGDHGDRYCGGDDEGAAKTAQKEQQHQHGQPPAVQG